MLRAQLRGWHWGKVLDLGMQATAAGNWGHAESDGAQRHCSRTHLAGFCTSYMGTQTVFYAFCRYSCTLTVQRCPDDRGTVAIQARASN